jgi:hypothetical protein
MFTSTNTATRITSKVGILSNRRFMMYFSMSVPARLTPRYLFKHRGKFTHSGCD